MSFRSQVHPTAADSFARHQVDAAAAQHLPNPQVLFLSHTYDDGVFKVGSHHLTRELALMGLNVAHISTPFSLVHRLFAASQPRRRQLVRSGPRVDINAVTHLVPTSLLPAQYSNDAYLLRALRAVRMERPDFIFLDQPLMLCKKLFDLGATTIYRPTDLYLNGAARRAQSKYVGMFHGVAATSEEILQSLLPATRQPRIVIPNGVEYARFRLAEATAPRSGAVYVGALDGRFDWYAITSMARAFPGLPIALVGPTKNVPAAVPANVEILGPMDYAAVPQYLARFRIGLLPLSDDPSNAGRSPMKLFEYMAAGLHVVARSVRGLTARTDLPGCFFYADEREAAQAVSRAMAASSPNTAGIESARAQDWREKARQLWEFARSVATQSPAAHEADCVAT